MLAQLAPASVALAICLYQLTMPNVLFGIHGFSGNGYDDGVYLGAAVSFVHGVIPYRDFAFLQPPGVVLLFSPVALIARIAGTRDALAIARCITAAVTALNVLLITRILRARGSVAMVTGGLALACFPLAVAADHSLLLEPYLVFFSLLGVKLLFDGDSLVTSPRIVAAGVALGFAGAIKIWAIAVVIAALLVCAPRAKGVAVRLVLGVAAGFALPCIPFFIAAPSNFVHDVVVAQLSRGTSGLDGLSVLQRVIDISGVTGITAITPTTFLAVAIVAGFSVFVFLVYGLDYRKLGRFDILLLVIPALVLVEMFSSLSFTITTRTSLPPFWRCCSGRAPSTPQPSWNERVGDCPRSDLAHCVMLSQRCQRSSRSSLLVSWFRRPQATRAPISLIRPTLLRRSIKRFQEARARSPTKRFF